MITVTRRYQFSASHRLHLADLSEDENVSLYGKCNNPYGHGHDYILEVTCSGPVDPKTGLIVPLAELDRLIQMEILSAFSSRNLNLDIPEFKRLVPTTENIAIVIASRLAAQWRQYLGDSAALTRVHIQETARNGFELLTGAERSTAIPGLETTIHA